MAVLPLALVISVAWFLWQFVAQVQEQQTGADAAGTSHSCVTLYYFALHRLLTSLVLTSA
jgi:hypothetical protein